MRFHENIRGLDVAVNHAFLVRVLDRLTDLHEQLESIANAEMTRIAVMGDAFAVDEFHHKKRTTAGMRAGVQDPHAFDDHVAHGQCRGAKKMGSIIPESRADGSSKRDTGEKALEQIQSVTMDLRQQEDS